MYNDNSNDLAHHGIKGQKWGIINKKDDADSRVASEKNRLNYDKNVAGIEAEASVENNRINQENKTARYQIKNDTATSVTLGRQQIAEVFAREKTVRQESDNNRQNQRDKYKTIGMAAVMGCFAAMSLGKAYLRTVGKIANK